MRAPRYPFLFIVPLLSCLWFSARAQTHAVNVSATILSPISVNSVNAYNIGYVLAGGGEQGFVSTDPEAGSISISKSDLNGMTLAITVPSTLSGPSGATMAFICNSTAYGSYTPTGGSAVAFNPASPGATLTNILQSSSGAVFKLAGKVNPGVSQAVGTYTGQFIVTMAYAALF
jgi:hypothetical protein